MNRNLKLLIIAAIILFFGSIISNTARIDFKEGGIDFIDTPDSGWWTALAILTTILAGAIGLEFYNKKEFDELANKVNKNEDNYKKLDRLTSLLTVSLDLQGEFSNNKNKWEGSIDSIISLMEAKVINSSQARKISEQAWMDGLKYYCYQIRKANYSVNEDDFKNVTYYANILTHMYLDYKFMDDGYFEKLDDTTKAYFYDPKKFEKLICMGKYDGSYYYVPTAEGGLVTSGNKLMMENNNEVFHILSWQNTFLARYYFWVHNDLQKSEKFIKKGIERMPRFYYYKVYFLIVMTELKKITGLVAEWETDLGINTWNESSLKTNVLFRNFANCYCAIIKNNGRYNFDDLLNGILFEDVLKFLNMDVYRKVTMVGVYDRLISLNGVNEIVQFELLELYKVFYILNGAHDKSMDGFFNRCPDKAKDKLGQVLKKYMI